MGSYVVDIPMWTFRVFYRIWGELGHVEEQLKAVEKAREGKWTGGLLLRKLSDVQMRSSLADLSFWGVVFHSHVAGTYLIGEWVS